MDFLTVTIFLPALGALVIMLHKDERYIRGIALLFSVSTFVLSLPLWFGFDAAKGPYAASIGDLLQFEVDKPWVEALNIRYHIGLDGIALLLYMLTTFLTPLCIWGSFPVIKGKLGGKHRDTPPSPPPQAGGETKMTPQAGGEAKVMSQAGGEVKAASHAGGEAKVTPQAGGAGGVGGVKGYYIAFLLLETGMLGVFAALDLALFYVFWEAMLIPMYLLIGIWGGQNRIYAAVKFIIYTMVGSLLMLVGILWLAFNAVPGETCFDVVKIMATGRIAAQAQMWLFGAFALAFAIKVPMFPFHTWLPDAHTEAPTAGSIILAGVLLKMGTFGFIRYCIPLFPLAAKELAGWMVGLALVGIVYGALVTILQTDMKRLIAYSSVSHLGFVMLGLFAFNIQGMQGGTLQMVNHGLSTGALFFLVGVIYERRHTRLIAEYGGLAKSMPKYATLFLIVALSSIGLPGLNGFVGEFLVLVGAFKAHPAYGIIGASGVILAAVYLLWMYQRVFFGEIKQDANRKVVDLTTAEKVILVCFLVFIVWIGVHPSTFTSVSENAVKMALSRVI